MAKQPSTEEWLTSLGLDQYTATFNANGVDGDVLPFLTADDLKDIGVTAVGHRRKMLKAIAALQASLDSATENASLTPADHQLDSLVEDTQVERRQLTVVFVDLAGSTELSQALDPEDMREVVRAYQNTVAGDLLRFDGHVAKFMGDGVLAYFGWPRAHEDDAERAVRAALAITAHVQELKSPHADNLTARIGIATGLVVVGELMGSEEARERTVTGDAPNLAARLQSIAHPGSIVIDEATRRLIGALFVTDELGKVSLKGIMSPVSACIVRAGKPAPNRFEARTATLRPLIARDPELALLTERWRQSCAGFGQVVFLVGEAGIGKSRLTRALTDLVLPSETVILRLQGSPLHTDSAFWPVCQQIAAAADVRLKDIVTSRADKVRAFLTARTPLGAEEIELVLGTMDLGNQERAPMSGMTAEQHRVQTIATLGRYMILRADTAPLLLLAEDAHWFDRPTLELLESMSHQVTTRRVLVLVTSRPEACPRLEDYPTATTITLNRLDPSAAEALARRSVDQDLPDDAIKTIIARADGVPLYLEELAKAVAERGGTLDFSAGRSPVAPSEMAIPASLHASLTARLDRLPAARTVAQVAACLGREFTFRQLEAVAQTSAERLSAGLRDLQEAELIFQFGTPPDAVYSFKHALVRDAAYESLLKTKRRDVHARIATALEHDPELNKATSAEVLAYHCSEAGAFGRAAKYWLEAGRDHARRAANAEALRFFDRALVSLKTLPDDEDRRRTELEIRLAMVPALMATAGFSASRIDDVAQEAIRLCEEFNEVSRLAPLLFGQFSLKTAVADFEGAFQIASRIADIGARTADPLTVFMGHRALGFCFSWTGKLMNAEQHLAQALEVVSGLERHDLALKFGHEPIITAQIILGSVKRRLGAEGEGDRVAAAALQEAEALGHPLTLAYVLRHQAIFDTLSEHIAHVQKLGARLQEICHRYAIREWQSLGILFELWAVSRNSAIGGERFLEALERHRASNFRLNLPFFLMIAADGCTKAGNTATAIQLLDEAAQLISSTGEVWIEPYVAHRRGALSSS
jgi:class 3 adenylate cyclase/ABC-type transport system involved in cytochrome c biogenesis ATPase subunit/tetratricopeptide (TPR) repeat protein